MVLRAVESIVSLNGLQLTNLAMIPLLITAGSITLIDSFLENTDFQYVNWVHSPTGPTTDIGKILRLTRRLPDKSALLFKVGALVFFYLSILLLGSGHSID